LPAAGRFKNVTGVCTPAGCLTPDYKKNFFMDQITEYNKASAVALLYSTNFIAHKKVKV
jgi:hypothetical protein